MSTSEDQLSWSIEFLDCLISELEKRAIQIGVDDVLRLQIVLNSLSPKLTRSQIGQRLRPVVVASDEQQTLFDEAYEAVYDESPVNERLKALRQKGIILPAEKEREIRSRCREAHPATTVEELNHLITESSDVAGAEDLLAKKAIWPVLRTCLIAILLLAILSMGSLLISRRNTTAKASADLVKRISKSAVTGARNGSAPTKTPPIDTTAVTKPDPQVTHRPIVFQIESHDRTKQPDPLIIVENGIQAETTSYVGGMVGGAVIALIVELIRRWRMKVAVKQALSAGGPFHWDINLSGPKPWSLFEKPEIWTIARLLRKKSLSGAGLIDAARTIRDTSVNAGLITLRYKAASRHVDHLILIDRQSRRDHFAQLYADLADGLDKYGVQSEVFTYAGDPRVCRRKNGDRVLLSTLALTHQDARLLVLGSGRRFVDVTTGELAPWTAAFKRWSERLLVSPVPKASWDLTEATVLPGVIPVVSCSFRDLTASAFALSAGQEPKARENRNEQERPIESADVGSLSSYLGRKAMFKWLCACAVYPELHFDLTMSLGQKIANASYEDCIRLFALPWFREGLIPNAKRSMLLDTLSDEELKAANRLVSESLEASNKPPEGSRAWRQFQLELALQHWMAKRDADSKKKLQDAAAKGHPKDLTRNAILQEMIKRSKIDFTLSDRLRKLIYPHGIRSFGAKRWVAPAVFLYLAASITGMCLDLKYPREIPQPVQIEQIAAFPTVPNKVTIDEVGPTKWQGIELQFQNYTDARFRVSSIELEGTQPNRPRPATATEGTTYSIPGGDLRVSKISDVEGIQICRIEARSDTRTFSTFRGNLKLLFESPTPSASVAIECTPGVVGSDFNPDLLALGNRFFGPTEAGRTSAARDLLASKWRTHPDTVPALVTLSSQQYANERGVYSVLDVILDLEENVVRPSEGQLRTLLIKLDGDSTRKNTMVLAKRLRDRYFKDFKFPSEKETPWVVGRWISADGLAEMTFEEGGRITTDDNVGYKWTGTYTLSSSQITAILRDPIDGNEVTRIIGFSRDRTTLQRGQDYRRAGSPNLDEPPSWLVGAWEASDLARTVKFETNWTVQYTTPTGTLAGQYSLSNNTVTVSLGSGTSRRTLVGRFNANHTTLSFDGIRFVPGDGSSGGSWNDVPAWILGYWTRADGVTAIEFTAGGKYIQHDVRSEARPEGDFNVLRGNIYLDQNQGTTARPDFTVDEARQTMRQGSTIYRKGNTLNPNRRISVEATEILVNGRSDIAMTGAGKFEVLGQSFTENYPQIAYRFEFNADGQKHNLSGRIGIAAEDDQVIFDGTEDKTATIRVTQPNRDSVVVSIVARDRAGKRIEITITTRRGKPLSSSGGG